MDGLKLRTYDGIAVAGFLLLPPLFSTGLSALAEQNDTAAWIAVLVAFTVMLCLFLAISGLMKRHEGKNIIEASSAVMGRPLGTLYGVMLSAYFCFFSGIHIRESAEVLKIYGLKLTPLYVVAGLILISAVIMNFFGWRAIVKSAGYFFIVVALGIAFIMLLGFSQYNPDNLVPVLGAGMPDISRNGLFMASMFDGVIVLFLLAPAFSSADKLKKSGVLALAFAAAAFVLLYVCYIMMFSPSVGSKMMSGFIEMGKSSYYSRFFYRFESILLFFLIFSSAMQASIGLFIAKESLACAIKLKPVKMLTVICAAAVTAAMLIPRNVFELTQIYLPVIREYSIFFMAGFPLAIFMAGAAKRCFKI